MRLEKVVALLGLVLHSVFVATGAEWVFAADQPPRIHASEEDVFIDGDMVVEAGSTFSLQCQAQRPVKWSLASLPKDLSSAAHVKDLNSRAHVEDVSVDAADDGFVHRLELTVRNASHLDTGYYACLHDGFTNAEDVQEAVRLYVFVHDERELIVSSSSSQDIVLITFRQSQRSVIPCKPTHPHVVMTLLRSDEEQVEVDDETVLYDARQGFILSEASVVDVGYVECHAVSDTTVASLAFIVQVNPETTVAPKPHINGSLASRVMVDQTFSLNCSVTYDPGVGIDLIWTWPPGIDEERIVEGDMVRGKLFSSHIEQWVTHKMLTVSAARSTDSGTYQCTCIDHNDKTQVTDYDVRVHEGHVAYVNLTAQTTEVVEEAGKLVRWVVKVDAFPKPTIRWFSPTDAVRPIRSSTKYEVRYDDQSLTSLQIGHVELGDAGVYRLLAEAGSQSQQLDFTLRVLDKPRVSTRSEASYVHLDDTFEFVCRVEAYPSARISLAFRECPPAQLCDTPWTFNDTVDATVRQDVALLSGVNGETVRTPAHAEFRPQEVVVRGRARRSGQYLCRACNARGCSVDDNATSVDVYVRETRLPFSLVASSGAAGDRAVEGDAVGLVCSASLYDFTRKMTWHWTLPNGDVIQIDKNNPPAGMRIRADATFSYTHVERLEWNSVTVKANGTYTCQVYAFNMRPSSSSLELRVLPVKAPTIWGQRDAELAVPQGNEIQLVCRFDGTPRPDVLWTKDDQPINATATSDDALVVSFQYARKEHSGLYRCTASNKMGETAAEYRVDVLDPSVDKGIIAAIVVVIAIVVALALVLAKKIYDDKKRKAFFSAHHLDNFDKGNPESLNPDLPVDEQAELLPYDRKWEFPRDRLKLGKQLGAGAFGRVLKGEAIGINDGEAVTTVAVKMVRAHGNMLALKALMSELKIMVHLGSHLNVVNVLGACTKRITKGELLVIVEYCRFGNLQNYLIHHRDSFINQVDLDGRFNPSLGAESLARAAAMAEYDVPRSPLGYVPNSVAYTLNASIGETTMTDLSMAPTGGGTVQSDMASELSSDGCNGGVSRLDSRMSQMSTASNGAGHPTWRSNYRGDYVDLPDQTALCTHDLICWAFQIARGMEYLASRKVLHGDLAARNILLADDRVVKIADFGLAREVYRSGNYKKKGEGPLPVKWMAIESIVDRVFSTQSDVWAFGVVLWELFSLGKSPYPGMDADEHFFRKLVDGYRMEKPRYATNELYDVMDNCWKKEPRERPTFSELEDILGDQLEHSVRRHYMDLNDPHVRANAQRVDDYLVMASANGYVNVPEMQTDGGGGGASYVNVPRTSIDSLGPKRDSDYLTMSSPSLGGSSLCDGYLTMNVPATPASVASSGIGAGRLNSTGSAKFDFEFAPRLRRVVEEEPVDATEMRPMLNAAVETGHYRKPGDVFVGAATPAHGFSNPYYQQHVAFNCSDLDDSPAPASSDQSGQTQYVNAPVAV